ncbi:macrolide-binding protein fkbp12 [Moniliophthora roreri]|nr:macrolide-binding protein fkbp12 [Moniliophthora roreri]
MGVTIQCVKPGDKRTFPRAGGQYWFYISPNLPIEKFRHPDIVSIHYVGTLEDGSKFDSSFDRGRPFQVELGSNTVIKGWEEGRIHCTYQQTYAQESAGVLRLSKGEKAILTIPPDLAYGDRGVPPLIPKNATLKFEMELLEIHRPVS